MKDKLEVIPLSKFKCVEAVDEFVTDVNYAVQNTVTWEFINFIMNTNILMDEIWFIKDGKRIGKITNIGQE